MAIDDRNVSVVPGTKATVRSGSISRMELDEYEQIPRDGGNRGAASGSSLVTAAGGTTRMA
ncbi:hypothetical protein ACFWUP_21750 [Nocardia sp. NPDC058658]|uniref:hypothetical protein n=1 Tax=Nocardia sp. NPDC058658 TaxID=3346580 RepID=UPI00365D5149